MTNLTTAQPVVVAALYKFAPLDKGAAWCEPLLDVCHAQGLKGTLLLAPEGINGTVAGSREGIDHVLGWLRGIPQLVDLEHKESYHAVAPFHRMKVRWKAEIVSLGRPEADPNRAVGTYVEPNEWNALIQEPDVVVVDTRNAYECAIGGFRGAVDPKTSTFREFPDYVDSHLDPKRHKRVAMYCTGGIRCEKATALLLQRGFESVYHLRGGILKYLETVPEAESLWEGDCFVFDERVAVTHGLERGEHEVCRGCRMPVSAADRESPDFRAGICCPRCVDALTPEKAARCAERHRQVELAAARNAQHIGRQDESSSAVPR